MPKWTYIYECLATASRGVEKRGGLVKKHWLPGPMFPEGRSSIMSMAATG